MPFEKVRKAVGDRMDIAAELHSLWSRPQAIKIAQALDRCSSCGLRIRCSWTTSIRSRGAARDAGPHRLWRDARGRADFRALLELEALSMLIMDVTWGGGVSEARKVAAMAEAWHVPVAFHDCTGPVALAVSTHLALHARNCWVQEMVRAFYYGWYHRFVTVLPPVRRGGSRSGGAGTRARPETRDRQRPDAAVRRTTPSDL